VGLHLLLVFDQGFKTDPMPRRKHFVLRAQLSDQGAAVVEKPGTTSSIEEVRGKVIWCGEWRGKMGFVVCGLDGVMS
jgi:hypothetical protein